MNSVAEQPSIDEKYKIFTKFNTIKNLTEKMIIVPQWPQSVLSDGCARPTALLPQFLSFSINC